MSAERARRETLGERRARRADVEDVQVVLEAAARFLEARPRSVAEVRRRLGSAGYRAELVELAVGRLGELGLLDDHGFARGWVESRDRARPRGEHALRRELALKGVERAVVDDVLASRRGEDRDDWQRGAGDDARTDPDRAAADRLLERRRAAVFREPDPRLRVRKAYALLARNGFSPDVCRDASRSLAAGIAEELPSD